MMVPVDVVVAQLATLLPLSDRTVHILYVNEKCGSCESLSHMLKMYANDRWEALRHPATCIDECVRSKIDEAEQLLAGKCRRIEREIVCGPPGLMIDTVAREDNVDVTVLTLGSQLMRSTMFSGHASHSRLCRGPTATFLANPLTRESVELRNILVQVSCSCSAEDIVLKVVDLFQLNRKRVNVILLHVVDVLDPIKCISPANLSSHIEQNMVEKGEKLLAEVKQLFQANGVRKVAHALVHGKSTHELMVAAKAVPADVIITTAHERNGVESFFQRRLLERMIIESPCAVTVIKEHDGARSKEQCPVDVSSKKARAFFELYV
jgi:nucleotide-binding universal stress UspA family protein